MRVLLIDDRPQMRSALRCLLEQEPGLSIVGEAAETKGLLAQVHEIRPDLVLLDWELPGLQAADLLPSLHVLRCPPKVVAFSERREARQEALAAGADAFVSREDPPEWLLNTLRRVGRLSPYFVG